MEVWRGERRQLTQAMGRGVGAGDAGTVEGRGGDARSVHLPGSPSWEGCQPLSVSVTPRVGGGLSAHCGGQASVGSGEGRREAGGEPLSAGRAAPGRGAGRGGPGRRRSSRVSPACRRPSAPGEEPPHPLGLSLFPTLSRRRDQSLFIHFISFKYFLLSHRRRRICVRWGGRRSYAASRRR